MPTRIASLANGNIYSEIKINNAIFDKIYNNKDFEKPQY
jgi:hypothetical protein